MIRRPPRDTQRRSSAASDVDKRQFLFRANSELGSRSGVLKVTATGRRIDGYEWVPARINGANQPIPAEGQEAQNLLASWNELRGCTGLTDAATAEPTPAG